MKHLIFIFYFMLSSCLFGQKTLSKADFTADLDYLYMAIKRQHPAPFKYHSQLQFDSLRTNIINALPLSMNRQDAFFKLRTFVAFICDAHTQVLNQPKETDKRALSAEFEIIAGSLHLKRNTVDSILNGAKIVSINEIEASSLLESYGSIISGDETKVSFKYAVAAFRLGNALKTFFNMRDTITFKLETLNGSDALLVLKYDSINLLKPLKNNEGEIVLKQNETLKLIKNADSNYVLRLSTFQDRKYKSYYASMFSYLEDHKVDTLIIDLRNNTGGNFYHAYHLLNYICADTLALTFSRKTHQGSHYFRGFQKVVRLFGFFYREVINGGKIEKRSGMKYSTSYFSPIIKHHFKGKVIVLANGLSMSSSTIVAYYLKHKAHATILGEAGGGEFGNCGGTFPKIKLPHTKMKIKFPSYWLDYQLK